MEQIIYDELKQSNLELLLELGNTKDEELKKYLLKQITNNIREMLEMIEKIKGL
jgi:hypothetical protein